MDTSRDEGLRQPAAAGAVGGGMLLAGTVTTGPQPARPGGIGPELDRFPLMMPGLPPLDQGSVPSRGLRLQRRARQQRLLRLRTLRQS